MSQKHYQLIIIGDGFPATLTVTGKGMPVVALSGELKTDIDPPVTHSGVAATINMTAEKGAWQLSVVPETGGKITVTGKRPVFSDTQPQE